MKRPGWFVYSEDNHLEFFGTEEEAKKVFGGYIEEYRDLARGDEWDDGVEDLAWGKVMQTVDLKPVRLSEEDPLCQDCYDAVIVNQE